ncbi:MFS transporter [Aestuariimicrobium soli]|uniref:MFS transporter n=1 Tax=Aestuariimicrobium soli TaxID=2035834 RepID=UPI003EBF2F83
MTDTRQTAPWRYALGMFGMSIPITMIRGSLLLFYVDILGLDVRAYGIVMGVYAVIDAIDNPVLGWLSDRTRTRFGRRKPWLVVGTVLVCAGLVAFFTVPSAAEGAALVAWFAVFAILCEAADSMVSANYGALLPELFPTERQRALANGLRQGFQLVALVISLALTPLLTTAVFGTETSSEGFSTTAVIYAGIALVSLLVMALGVHENPRYAHESSPPFLSSIRSIVTTRLFWVIAVAGACYLIPLAMVVGGLQLYIKYWLRRPVSDALVLQGLVIVVAGACVAGWTAVIRRRGAPMVWRIGYCFLVAGFAALWWARGLVGAIVAGCIIAVGWAGLMATTDLIQARLLDDDARRHGVHREGVFLSVFGVFGRLSAAGNGLALASLAWLYGYHSGDDPGPRPGEAFRTYLGLYPALIAVVGLVLAFVTRVPEAGAVPVADLDDIPEPEGARP